MCISLFPAEMSNTVLYTGEALIDGKLVHVLGYYNTTKNLSNGPNAMILPFPAKAKMTQENVIDTSECKDFMKSYGDMFKDEGRRYKGLSRGITLNSDGFNVFNSGNYTVILAENNASVIPNALKQVPEDRRPRVNQEVFDKIAELYPNWPVALCCFNGTMEAEPMLWWYEPKDPDVLFAPALDAHDGGAPDVKAMVKVDHTVVAGSTINPKGERAYFVDRLPENVSKYVASRVNGRKYDKIYMPNGDFFLKKSDFVTDENYSKGFNKNFERKAPKAA